MKLFLLILLSFSFLYAKCPLNAYYDYAFKECICNNGYFEVKSNEMDITSTDKQFQCKDIINKEGSIVNINNEYLLGPKNSYWDNTQHKWICNKDAIKTNSGCFINDNKVKNDNIIEQEQKKGLVIVSFSVVFILLVFLM